jgi:hypothetical protein
MDGKIVDSAEYGEHIALTCVNHPRLRWSTKNIAPIGCVCNLADHTWRFVAELS